jgi:hypothetical protein
MSASLSYSENFHARKDGGWKNIFLLAPSFSNFWISSPSGIAKHAGQLQECKKYQLLYAKLKIRENNALHTAIK